MSFHGLIFFRERGLTGLLSPSFSVQSKERGQNEGTVRQMGSWRCSVLWAAGGGGGGDGQVGPRLSLKSESYRGKEKGSWDSAGVGAWDAEDFVKVSGWSGRICQSGQRPCQG